MIAFSSFFLIFDRFFRSMETEDKNRTRAHQVMRPDAYKGTRAHAYAHQGAHQVTPWLSGEHGPGRAHVHFSRCFNAKTV
jgi:hypothetical protein